MFFVQLLTISLLSIFLNPYKIFFHYKLFYNWNNFITYFNIPMKIIGIYSFIFGASFSLKSHYTPKNESLPSMFEDLYTEQGEKHYYCIF